MNKSRLRLAAVIGIAGFLFGSFSVGTAPGAVVQQSPIDIAAGLLQVQVLEPPVFNYNNGVAKYRNPGSTHAGVEIDGFGGVNSLLSHTCPAGQPEPFSPSSLLPVESRPEGFAFDNNAAAGLVTAVHADAYLRAAERVAEVALQHPDGWLPCAPADALDACAVEYAKLGRRPPDGLALFGS